MASCSRILWIDTEEIYRTYDSVRESTTHNKQRTGMTNNMTTTQRTWICKLNATSNNTSFWPATANAHAVVARLCGSKARMRCSAAVATAANSSLSFWLVVANAHAVLARFCSLKSPMRCSAAVVNDANNS